MRILPVLGLSLLLVGLWGCGGNSGPSQPTLDSITVTPSTTTLWVAFGTQQFTATGHYSDGNSRDLTSAVTWSSSSTGIATVNGSGLATPVAAGTTSIQAASGAVSGSSSVKVVGLAGAYITPSGPALSLSGSPSSAQLSLTAVWTDGKTQDVTSLAGWSSSDISVAGVNATGYLTRATNAGYATITANWNLSNISTAVSVTTQNMTVSNLNGTYVFLVNGIDYSGPAFFTGMFNADGNGSITGEQVSTSQAGIIPMPDAFTGSYSVFPDGRGDMTIVPSTPLTTTRLRFALEANGDEGRMILFDPANPTAMMGAFQKQAGGPFSTASLQGTYVFKLGGADYNNLPQTIVGMLTVDGANQVVSGLADWNDNGVVNNGAGRDAPLGVTGSYILNADGHGAMTLTIASAELHFAMFVVNNGLFQLLCTDQNNRLLGQFELQQMPQGGFQSMDGNYTFLLENGGRSGVFGMGGELDLGPLSGMDGWANVTSPASYSDLEVLQGTRVMGTNGRGTLDVMFFVRPYANDANYSFAAYMVSPTRMYLIETDTQAVYAGLAQGTNSGLLNGSYIYIGGGLKVASGTESSVLALLNATATDSHNGTFTGIVDVNLPVTGMPAGSRAFGSIVANGTFTADVNSIYTKWLALFTGNQNFTFYINSGSQAVMFGQTGANDNPDLDGWMVLQ
jgi:hypothetical protein